MNLVTLEPWIMLHDINIISEPSICCNSFYLCSSISIFYGANWYPRIARTDAVTNTSLIPDAEHSNNFKMHTKETIDLTFSLQRSTNRGQKYETRKAKCSSHVYRRNTQRAVALIIMHGRRRAPEINCDRWTSNERRKKVSTLRTHEALTLIAGRVSDFGQVQGGYHASRPETDDRALIFRDRVGILTHARAIRTRTRCTGWWNMRK